MAYLFFAFNHRRKNLQDLYYWAVVRVCACCVSIFSGLIKLVVSLGQINQATVGLVNWQFSKRKNN